MHTSLRKYFFAGASAALALIFFIWHVGYTAGLTRSLQTQGTQTSAQANSRSVIGKIIDITGTTLTLDTPGLEPTKREVRTDSETAFGRLVPKDQDIYQKEVETFRQQVQVTTESGGPFLGKNIPAPFLFEKISLTDLQVGSIVQVTAATDVLSRDRFTAVRVMLWPSSLPSVVPRSSP